MGKVIGSVSVSIDGYIAGPNAGPGNPLDDGGRLHAWISSPTAQDSEVLNDWDIPAGAVIVGRRMFEEGEEPWGEDPPWHVPLVIVTHHARPFMTKEGGTTYTFVTDGIEAALVAASQLAGDTDVMVGGGAKTLEEFLFAGLVDELRIHFVPVVMGNGRRLFGTESASRIELEPLDVIASSGATHVKYRVIK
jgi:dihydrofolate reductase